MEKVIKQISEMVGKNPTKVYSGDFNNIWDKMNSNSVDEFKWKLKEHNIEIIVKKIN